MEVVDTGVCVDAVNKVKEDRNNILARLGCRHLEEGAAELASGSLALASGYLQEGIL